MAKLSKNHPQGQLLSEVFQIQTPWILMHQTIRTVLLDYVEDHQIGTVWSHELLSIRFRRDYFKAIAERNQRVERLQKYGLTASFFHTIQPEEHLIKMGIESCIGILLNSVFQGLLSNGSIERMEANEFTRIRNIRMYCAPDLLHRSSKGLTIIKFQLYGKISRSKRIQQASLLQSYGNDNSEVIQFCLQRRKWNVHKTIPIARQRKQASDLVVLDLKQIETVFSKVEKNNDLTKIPLADSYRSCTNCNVKFMCPVRTGYENAKAEQRVLMCQ
ncbi:MAG TPA: hypothetical protein HA358_00520 [Candidatus Poseidoniaceae archaeon]|nr:hypothetical protein [Candidatus Poseidoniaceae archaeon]